jgi:Zn finger protein HypA/HybF involved in hydrogenase expression
MNRWWCMDCRSAVDLDAHGRCGSCESEAVDILSPHGIQAAPTLVVDADVTTSVSCS